jgi:hypothetical protein
MSGQNGPDEAARLEMALARIARAASRRTASVAETADGAALHGAPPRATTPPGGSDTAEIAARLDSLIAEIRALLGPHDF